MTDPKPKHTPGPWEVYETPFGFDVIRAERHDLICEPYGPDKKANARLISAAPELYEALKELMDVQGKSVIGAPVKPWSNAMDKALRAVKKVEGDNG